MRPLTLSPSRLVWLATLAASRLACTPFVGTSPDAGQRADAADASAPFDATGADGASKDIACVGEGLAVGTLRRVASGAWLTPRLTSLSLTGSGAQALLVVRDDGVQRFRARRLDARGAPVDPNESIELSARVSLRGAPQVTATSNGWLALWRDGLAWISADGAVLHHELTPTVYDTLFEFDGAVALGWRDDHATAIYVLGVPGDEGTPCEVRGIDLYPDGRRSTARTLVGREVCEFNAVATLDARGGVLLMHSPSFDHAPVRVVRLGEDGRAGSPETVPDATEGQLRAVVATAAGAYAALMTTSDGASARVLRVGASETRVGRWFPLDGAFESFAATAEGFLIAASRLGSHHLPAVTVLALDASGAPFVVLDERGAEERPTAADAHVALASDAAGAPMAVWALPSSAPMPTVQSRDPRAPRSGNALAWQVQQVGAQVERFTLTRGARPWIAVGAVATPLDDDGVALPRIALPGQADALVAVDDALWAFVRAPDGTTVVRADARGSVVDSSRLPGFYVDSSSAHRRNVEWVGDSVVAAQRLEASWGVSFGFRRIARDAAYATPALLVGASPLEPTGTGALHLIAGAQGAFLWLQELVGEVEARGFDGADAPLFDVRLPIAWDPPERRRLVRGAPAMTDGWPCGRGCWGVASTRGLFRVDAAGVRRLPAALPESLTGVAAASGRCAAVVALRDADDAVFVARVDPSGDGALRELTALPVSAEYGLSLVAAPDGRFVLAVSGTDRAEPLRPGLFVVPLQAR